MLKSIETNGFKKDNIYNFKGLDLIIGSNGSGKSTAFQALQFAITGKINNIDEKNESLFAFCNNTNNMSVIADFDDFSIKRGLSKESSIKESLDCNLIEKGTLKEKNKIILENTIGNPMIINFNKFLSMTQSEKKKFIFSLISESSKLEQDTINKYLLENIEDIKLVEILKEKCNNSIEESVNSMLEFIDSKKKVLNSDLKILKSSVKNLLELKSSSIESTNNLKIYKEQEFSLRKELSEIEKSIHSITKNNNLISSINTNINTTENDISNINTDISKYNLNDLKSKIEMLRKTNFSKVKNEINIKIINVKKEIESLKSTSDIIVAKGLDNKAEYKNTFNLIKKIEQQSISKCCILDKRIKCSNTQNFNSLLGDLKSNMNTYYENNATFVSQYEEIALQLKALEQELNTLNISKEELVEKTLNNNNLINKLENEIKNFDFLNKELKLKKQQLLMYKENKGTLTSEPIDLLVKRKNALNSSLNNLNTKIKECEKAQFNLISLEKTVLQRDKVNNDLLLYKKAYKIIEALQKKIIKDTICPIQSEIDKYLNLFLIGKFEFKCENANGKDIFKLGIIKKNVFSEFDALSTGEQLMLSVAFIIVLLNKINPKNRILIIDDIIHLHKDIRSQFFKSLVKIKEHLDNIIIIGALDSSDVLDIPKQINVIDMNKITNKNLLCSA